MDRDEVRGKIRLRRQNLRLSQEDAARLLDCRPGTVQKLEKGPMKITTEWLMRLGAAYGVDMQYFVGESSAPAPMPAIPIAYEIRGKGKVTAAKSKKRTVAAETAAGGVELVAAEIMEPVGLFYHKGDILLLDKGKQFRPKLCINRECIVEIVPHVFVLGIFQRGGKEGHYTITPYDGLPIKDTTVINAHRITRIFRA